MNLFIVANGTDQGLKLPENENVALHRLPDAMTAVRQAAGATMRVGVGERGGEGRQGGSWTCACVAATFFVLQVATGSNRQDHWPGNILWKGHEPRAS